MQQRHADLGSDAAGNVAHGSEQGQCTVRLLHGFEPHGRQTDVLERAGERGVSREVKIAEQAMAGFQQVEFLRLGLLDLDDEFG